MSADARDRLRQALARMRLYVLVTSDFCSCPPLDAAEQAIRGGADAVQMREKGMSDRDLLELGRAYRRLCTETGALFIVNDRPDIARLCEADGVHLGQDDLPPAAARKILLPHQLVGISTHHIEQAREAVAHRADYLGVGPVYPTKTKGYEQGVGCAYVAQVARELDAPFVALGGIDAARAAEVAKAGGRAVAVCSAVIGASDIAAATREIRAAVTAGRQ